MAQIITSKEAANLINDGDVIVTGVDGLTGWPQEIVDAIEERFLSEGHPKNITHIRASGGGNFTSPTAESQYLHEGMMTKSISSFVSVCPDLAKKITDNEIMGWMLPLGVFYQMYREIGRGMKGAMSKVGLGTFMDPRNDGGKLNQLTMDQGEDLVKYVPDFMGEEYLYYTLPKLNIGLMRGTTADKHGNISCEKEPINLGLLSQAQAVKANGGIVICQVEKIVEVNEIHPRMVKVPGIYVDYLVVAEKPDEIMQNWIRSNKDGYNPAFTGEAIAELEEIKPMPLNDVKVLCRRAIKEFKPGYVINFGIGMPTSIPTVLNEQKLSDMVTMITETGVIGGVPALGRDFGCGWNPEALCDHGDHFSLFDGGNLDVGIFGLSEVDEKGNVNTSHLNGKIGGVGGFANISLASKHLIFIGTFTAVGIETKIENGKVVIVKEGKFKKFIKKCDKTTFIAEESLKKGNDILFITERCVIRRDKRGMVLEEVAPGIDIQTQILDQSEFKLIIPDGGPKLMDPELFKE